MIAHGGSQVQPSTGSTDDEQRNKYNSIDLSLATTAAHMVGFAPYPAERFVGAGVHVETR